ncbi:MAG: radical SAM protein [Elusimicrobiales bacterium]|nr:radical SAM protein [Elusimicrobiales bacterium]
MSGGSFSRRLDIFVTNRCNLACGYCSSMGMLGPGAGRALTPDELKRAVDLFGRCGGGTAPRTISFSGGEPLLEFEAVAAAARYIASRREKFLVSVTTNGTLLTRDRAARLMDHGVCLVLSLDGGRAATDRHRRFRAGGGSVFEAVKRNLERLPSSALRRLHVTLTVTSDTIGSVTDSARRLEDMGFASVEIGLDVYETWTPAKLALLGRALAVFRDRALRRADAGVLLGGGGLAFRSFFQDYDAGEKVLPLDTLCLSPEGIFFPCDALCAAWPRQDRYAVGDLRRGIDLPRLRRVYAGALSFIRRHGRTDGVLSPVDRYFFALARGKDPAVMLRNGAGVDRVFDRELGGLAAVENCAASACRAPRLPGSFRAARAALPPGPAACGAARALLSGGAGDRALIMRLPAGPRGPAAARPLLLYSLLAARGRRGRFAVSLEADGA